MRGQSRILLNYGKYYRVWPFADVRDKKLYVSIANVRPSAKPMCNLLRSKDYGELWSEVADFHSMNKLNTTTGQPFVTREGSIFVPAWNAGFYTDGVTWFAIYKSEDAGMSWTKVYEDLKGTYGKHFFQSPDGNLYIGVGQGGGGSRGKVSFRPQRSYLLLSQDMGENWETILKVNYPTALYSGVALDDEKVLVAAREKKSVFFSINGGETWIETRVGNITRSVSYIEELHNIVVTSNSALFISDDGFSWTQLNSPIKGLMLRYPTWYKRRLYMSGVGWRSYVVSTELNKWYLSFDVTKETASNLGARMAILNDYIFVGDEANGTLIRIELPLSLNNSVNLGQMLEGNTKYLISSAKYVLRRFIE